MGLILMCCDRSVPHHRQLAKFTVGLRSLKVRESALSIQRLFLFFFFFKNLQVKKETHLSFCHSTCKPGSMGKVQRPGSLHFAESCTTQQKEGKMQLNRNVCISRPFCTGCQKQTNKRRF